MKNRCVIVAGGDCDLAQLNTVDGSCFVIAADSGLKHCVKANIKPDLIVGDFDSYLYELPNDIEAITLPTHKDDTDLMFAARCGVERNFKRFTVLGGYGSRPDQNLAMYQTLCWITDNCKNAEVNAKCCGFEVYLINNGAIAFPADRDRYLSVFAIDGDAVGVDIVGAEYSLNNATIKAGFPIGVSNVAVSDTEISVKQGKLLIMAVDKNI